MCFDFLYKFCPKHFSFQEELSEIKVHPRTGHEGPEGEQSHSGTLSLTSALDGVWVNAKPRPLYPQE